MSKTNDTTKTCELIEAELAAVSGGGTFENILISNYVAAAGVGTVGGGAGTGTGSGFPGWDLTKNKGV